MEDNKPVIILGPTASGKSILSIRLAKNLNGEIVNADSMQIYKGFDIGTGKLKEEDFKDIRHHLLSFVDPEKKYSAGKYRKDALKIIKEIISKDKIPIIVGGTGFYIRTLLKGIAYIPDVPEEIRKNLNKWIYLHGTDYLYKMLSFIDPIYSKKINIKDKQRIERALEVIIFTGRPFSYYFKKEMEGEDLFPNIKIGLYLEKEELKKRIKERVERMIENGWLEEVKKLLDKKIPLDCQAFKSIGYGEMVKVLEGQYNLGQAIEIITRKTIAYSKRQMTWFKKEKDVFWIKAQDSELAFFSSLRYIKEKSRGEGYVK